MASFGQASLPFSGSGGPWEARIDWGAHPAAAAATPSYLAQPAQGLGQYGGAAPAAPAFGATVFHTTETLALESSPSAGAGPYSSSSWGHPQDAMNAPSPQQWGRQAALPEQVPAHYTQHLEQQNEELARQCRELQERLEAAAVSSPPAAAASTDREASPPPPPASVRRGSSRQQPGQRSTPPPSSQGDEPDRGEFEALQRRLAAKQREAEAAAAAAAAKQAQATAKEAELEQERGRAAELADEVARWKDECAQRERELRALQQRLEAAVSHAGLLEDGGAALRKKNAELGTALAQSNVTIRQLEDRLRSLQGSEGSKERQLDALHGEGEALLRENATLRQQVAGLEVDKQRLEEALRLARAEVFDLQCRNAELAAEAARAAAAAAAAAAVASPASDLRSSGSAANTVGSSARYQTSAEPACNSGGLQHKQHGTPPSWARAPSQATPPAMPAHQSGVPTAHPEQQWFLDPRSSLQNLSTAQAAWPHPYQMPPVQQRPQTAAGAPISHSQGAPTRSALQQFNQHATTPEGHAADWPSKDSRRAGQAGSAAAADASDACSISSDAAGSVGRLPLPWQLQNDYGSSIATSAVHAAPPADRRGAAQPPPPQADVTPAHLPLPWQLQNGYGSSCITPSRHMGGSSAGQAVQPQHLPAAARTSSAEGRARSDAGTDALGARLGALSVGAGTPGPSGSPFATEATLQDMLARTQALEDRLLALNAERNELEAESARMPSHTTGRTLQERKRRAEVERRLEELTRECSSVRLQLRRLGVK